ncbi:unnamed protein product [Peronospora destructor]|uniref:Polymerase nucleotidyl transferase domain-containing protein n=1 Tax=Peronospora destructor TaxID=86335 RepID=A0AAV0V6Q5_9STRA|nr:unnamed protein product [Peronospora destructor]
MMVHALHKDTDEITKERMKQKIASSELKTSLLSSKSSSSLGIAPVEVSVKKSKKQIKTDNKDTQEARDLLDQENVKSRNHNFVLARATSHSSSSCVSNTYPSWGLKKTKMELIKPVISINRTVTDALHEEILQYTMYTKKTVEKMAVHIEEMIANVCASVVSMWPQSKVETFGSYSTGIWLPSSDVDLVILDVLEVNDSKLTAIHLRELAKVLEKQKWVESLLVLETAKVPVLKLLSAGTSVPIDITFESAATHSGLLARDLIKRYADKMPELYPLGILFKQFLRERDLNDAYTGGLSSYSIVLMLIHFSQLWRNGDLCFEAASIYASGSLPPMPSKNQALKAERIQTESTLMNGNRKVDSECNAIKVPTSLAQTFGSVYSDAESSPKKSAFLLSPTPTSTYAAIVARAKQQPLEDFSRDTSFEPRFSYAAVAAGIAKVSEEKKPTGPPSSYAAAVSAPAGSSSPARRKSVMTAKKQVQDARLLDAISMSSSNADTEDSSSSCSHSSSTDSDDEPAKMLSHQSPASLGEHTMMIFEFFGIIFNYRKNGLSVRDGGYIYRLADSHCSHVGKPALVIEDPIHPDRNVSASSFAFSKVVALFEDSYYALKYFRASKFTPSALSCLLSTSGHTNHSRSKVQAVQS